MSMTCAEAEPLLPLVADGAVDPASDPGLFAHLATCPDCQRAVALHDLVTLALEASPPRPAERAPVRAWPWMLAAAAAVAAALVLWPQAVPAAPAGHLATVPPPSPAAGPAAPSPAEPAAPPQTRPASADVVAVPLADGGVAYLVRRDGQWRLLDPERLDGPVQPGLSPGEGVQVRY